MVDQRSFEDARVRHAKDARASRPIAAPRAATGSQGRAAPAGRSKATNGKGATPHEPVVYAIFFDVHAPSWCII